MPQKGRSTRNIEFQVPSVEVCSHGHSTHQFWCLLSYSERLEHELLLSLSWPLVHDGQQDTAQLAARVDKGGVAQGIAMEQ